MYVGKLQNPQLETAHLIRSSKAATKMLLCPPSEWPIAPIRLASTSGSDCRRSTARIWNHMRAVDLLQSLPEVDASRIGAIGHSLGGHNSIFLAVFDDRVKCVVSCCGFCSFPRYFGGDLTGWSHNGYMPRIRDCYGCDPVRVPFDFTEL